MNVTSVIKQFLLPLWLCLFSFSLFAEQDEQWECRSFTDILSGEDRFEPCFYVGFGFGFSHLDPNENVTNWEEDDKRDTGYKVYVGYQFARDWYAEIHYAELGEATFKNVNPNLGKAGIDYSVPALYAGYYFPVDDWWDWDWVKPYAKAGLSFISNESSSPFLRFEKESSTQLAVGLGLEFPFAQKWAVRTEVESFDLDATFVNVSLAYWFGKTYAVEKPTRVAEPEPEPEPVVEEPVIYDKDGDGVIDDDDQCPFTKKGIAVDEKGCERDTDGDGVLDSKDRCPNTAPGARVTSSGCYVIMKQSKSFNLDVKFASGKSTVTQASEKEINELVVFLKEHPQTTVTIEGHTDSIGRAESNKALSQKRADAVKDLMIKKHGIEANRITAKGYGEEQPVADNATKAGRAANRRVVAKVEALVFNRVQRDGEVIKDSDSSPKSGDEL